MVEGQMDSKRKRAASSRVVRTQKKQRQSRETSPDDEVLESASELDDGDIGGIGAASDGHAENEVSSKNRVLDKASRESTLNTTASKHVRFGSEELAKDLATDEETTKTNGLDFDVSDDSDDDAPEDVPVSAAQKGSKSAAAAVARAVEQQRKENRRKRQDQAARLETQAKGSSKKKQPKRLQETSTASESEEEASKMLPDELLVDDFERAPTPPPVSVPSKQNKTIPRKRRLDEPTAKDLKVGPVSVRVLEKPNPHLAPKAVRRSKDCRESWLKGRSSGRGVKAFERKPMNARFART